MNRSCTSGLRLVNPQAMRWLCPTLMKGRPGREKPSTLKSPEWSCTSYHTPGTRCGKCISLESSGLPETVCAPEMTQLFDPGRHASQEPEIRLKWRCSGVGMKALSGKKSNLETTLFVGLKGRVLIGYCFSA